MNEVGGVAKTAVEPVEEVGGMLLIAETGV